MRKRSSEIRFSIGLPDYKIFFGHVWKLDFKNVKSGRKSAGKQKANNTILKRFFTLKYAMSFFLRFNLYCKIQTEWVPWLQNPIPYSNAGCQIRNALDSVVLLNE